MIDFSRLRTLEQVQAERARLERDVEKQQERVLQDVCGVQALWQRRRRTIANLFHAVEYFIPKPQNKKTLLGIILSALVTRLLHRRRS